MQHLNSFMVNCFNKKVRRNTCYCTTIRRASQQTEQYFIDSKRILTASMHTFCIDYLPNCSLKAQISLRSVVFAVEQDRQFWYDLSHEHDLY